ncbi:sulfotransferase domain-containing protein [Roseovarius sp. M141]|uniref:sulfotransferase domain-containing protein n=1 Tax=Roseovarius sp. M141 TaxID=2583806 RepID=UPI0034E961A7
MCRKPMDSMMRVWLPQRETEKVLLSYYEDLVRNPSGEVRKVCDHIEIKRDARRQPDPHCLRRLSKSIAQPING